jgi:hypothetical protein
VRVQQGNAPWVRVGQSYPQPFWHLGDTCGRAPGGRRTGTPWTQSGQDARRASVAACAPAAGLALCVPCPAGGAVRMATSGIMSLERLSDSTAAVMHAAGVTARCDATSAPTAHVASLCCVARSCTHRSHVVACLGVVFASPTLCCRRCCRDTGSVQSGAAYRQGAPSAPDADAARPDGTPRQEVRHRHGGAHTQRSATSTPPWSLDQPWAWRQTGPSLRS